MSSAKQDLSSSSSSSMPPPPVLARTMTSTPALTTTTTTTIANVPQQQNSNNQISPSSKQTSIQLRGARPADEQPTHWLQRIRTVQLTTMTPEQREEIRRKTDEQAERYSKAKKLHAISHRTQNAKTTSYFAMDQNAVYRDRQNQVASVALMPPPPPYMMAGNNNNNNAPASAPAYQQQQPQHQQQAQLLMRQMDEDDELIAESFASSAPVRRNKKESEQPQQQQQGIRRPAIPVSAAREEKQMTTSAAWNQNQDADRERVTETEEQQALRSLQTEPKTDDERSAKFEIFEKFSTKMMKIRKDLDDTVAETVVELPPLPREAVKHSLTKLESDNCRGIFDQSRFWFVHDMFLQASKNCDLMNSISDEIARKIRMVATNSQSECPICLLTFATESNGEDQHQNSNDDDQKKNKQEGEEEDEPKVPAMLLSCCHKVCEECWDQWSKLKGARVYCPLCRNEEFMKEVAAGGAENNNNEEEEGEE